MADLNGPERDDRPYPRKPSGKAIPDHEKPKKGFEGKGARTDPRKIESKAAKGQGPQKIQEPFYRKEGP